jgi:hypothetical protein
MVETNQLVWNASLNIWQPQLISTLNTSPILNQELYVSKTGSDDTGNGSADNPFLTINYALSTIINPSSNVRYAVYVAPGEYSEPFQIRPWTAVIGAYAGSNGVSPNGSMLVEILADANTCGFSADFATSGFACGFMSGLGFQNLQTWDQNGYGLQPGISPQLNFFECAFGNGVAFLGPGTAGIDNVMLENCLIYNGLTVQGWKYLWTRNCTFLGGTINVISGLPGSDEDTIWLSQGGSVGASVSPTNIRLHQDGYGDGYYDGYSNNFARADLSNTDVVGDLILDGYQTAYTTTGNVPCSYILMNSANLPTSLACGGGGSGAFAYGSLINSFNTVGFIAAVPQQIAAGWSNGGSFDTTLNVADGTITTNVAGEFVINCTLNCQTTVDGSFLEFEIYQNGSPLAFTQVGGSAQGNFVTITITAMVSASIGDVFSLVITNNVTETVIINGDFSMFSPGGAQGPMGPAGPAGGPTGATGATGPQGATGPAGSSGGSGDYSLFYALMPGDNSATVAVGAAVEFPEDGPTTGIIVRTGATTFELPAVGDYEVNWQVSVDEPGQLQLAINGTGLAETVVGRASGTTQMVGSTFITTSVPNSILSVINPVGNSTALTITPIAGGASSVSATLTIKVL